ncbi:hypothetical protein HanIR_Chr10g0485131 [Helianthus annuus]|nr:hypothetical protein HanIR_Chr10g0485131 [Helianthus annuus]
MFGVWTANFCHRENHLNILIDLVIYQNEKGIDKKKIENVTNPRHTHDTRLRKFRSLEGLQGNCSRPGL